ncbi:acetylxylan esterase [Microbacterium sp. cf332]|uniref:acetylxylan esterase n=1 Tax=Microbacterium sp. cf332 TaxID=1761804 RepID=UPI00088264AC|nr:acetylxylan esterase [Microbacterium sp. cf332]SDQ30075.1 Acetyl xylan esterase (AXE1) [Microbacterium sp. cf332]
MTSPDPSPAVSRTDDADRPARPLGPLARYGDWPAYLAETAPHEPGDERGDALARTLGARRPVVVDIRVERTWTTGGVDGAELSWQLPYGPRTRAWMLRPAGVRDPLPGLLALHCHGGVRSVGAEQLLETDRAPHPTAARLRRDIYDGRAPANDLARAGFAVLAHDTFSWGSRAFDLSRPTPRLAEHMAAREALWRERGEEPDDHDRFDAFSTLHEDSLAKAAGMLGTSLAGAVASDDLAALDVLAGMPGVDAARLGAFGLSGGGGRAVLAAALDRRVSATVVTCMMATFASLVPAEIDTHSWLLHSPGIRSVGDWPDLARPGTGQTALVQYGRRDPLFPPEGMRAADAALAESPGYTGSFHDAGHVSSGSMQDEARAFLAGRLRA